MHASDQPASIVDHPRAEHADPRTRCRLIELPRINDQRGNLTFVESNRHLPFAMERIYYLYDVPGGESRGGHAHRRMHQVLIAAAGSLSVVVDDGTTRERFHLNRSYYGLYIPPMHWRSLEDFSSGSVCLALVSTMYDESDYIRDFGQYMLESSEAAAA